MKKYCILLLLAGFLGTSCSSKLVTEPSGQLSNEQLQEIAKTNPQAALAGLLNTMQDAIYVWGTSAINQRNWRVCLYMMDMQGNDMVQLKGSGWMWDVYQAQDFRWETKPAPILDWGFLYKYVYYANNVLDVIPADLNEAGTTDAEKSYIKAKAAAKTMRAWAYFQLIQLYQNDYLNQDGKDKLGVPIYTSAKDPAKGRATAAEVYAFIMSDLTDAVRLFAVDPTAETLTNITDIDASVANGVLARVALTIGEWQTALDAANYTLSKHPNLMNEDQYVVKKDILSGENPEAIWGYRYSLSSNTGKGTSSWVGWLNVLGDGGEGGEKDIHAGIDERLYNQIPDNDYRKKNFVDTPFSYTYATGTKLTIRKFTNLKFARTLRVSNQTNVNQDEVYMRTSEILLLKAEAQYRLGEIGDAQATLATLINARIIPPVDPNVPRVPVVVTATGLDLFQLIQLQTRIEMWGEGLEFFDNKRWDLPVDRTSNPPTNHSYPIVIPVGNDFTYQIPLTTEMNYNKFITEQNP